MENRNIVLLGGRSALTEMTADDQAPFHKWHTENPELRALIDDHTSPSLEDQMRWFERSQVPDRKIFAITALPDHTLIGHGGLVDIDLSEHTAQLRITIGNAAFWGKGFGTEATRLIVQYGFDTLHLESIWLRVLPTNTRAIRSYEKAGFMRVHDGSLTKHSPTKEGVWMRIHAENREGHGPVARGDIPASAITYVRNGGAAFEKCLRSVL